MTPALSRTLNGLGLLGIAGILAFAFADQLVLHDLPCPLCLLQRVGFVAAGLGLALNILFGSRPSHYGVAILGSLVGASVSVRQILLHIAPDTGSYGIALFGLHFYTWALIAFFIIVVAAAAMLFFERQFADWTSRPSSARPAGLALVAVAAFAALTLLNAGSTIAECGLGMCPDNPTGYEMLSPAATSPPAP